MRRDNPGPWLMGWSALLAGVLSGACSSAPADNGPDPEPEPEPRTAALACPGTSARQHILVDASHDGGVWWYPQGDGFDPGAEHQGQRLADYLRSSGYVVDELARGARITDTVLASYAGVIRAGKYGPYTASELRAYQWYLGCATTLVLLGDFLRDGAKDELALSVGINAQGQVTGTVSSFAEHPINEGATAFSYIAGSVLAEPVASGISVLGWLDTGQAVMGIVAHPTARIFFLGDTNGVEEVPQPLVDNLMAWGFAER